MYRTFIPLLFGGDINVYSMARAFHEAYGVHTVAYGFYPSGCCYGSDIIDYRVCDNNDDPEVILANVMQVVQENPTLKIIVLGCGDNYLTAIAQNLPNFPENVIAPYVTVEEMEGLIDKERFYGLCETHGIPYPDTVVYRPEMGEDFTLPFNGPFVVKPAQSAPYWLHPFEGQKKAYVLQTIEEVKSVIAQIYHHGFEGALIIQDFIPGDDSYMRVVTGYSDTDCKIRLMCVGHVLLEEHTDHGIGNHAVIITEDNPELCNQLKTLLETINFTGFSNFDVKYDQRDGKFKVFELNTRQGRSNYYVTGAGYNLAEYLVEDRILGKPHTLTITKNRHLWRVIPQFVANEYVNKDYLQDMADLIAKDDFVNPLYYKADKDFIHKLRIYRDQWRYRARYASVHKKKK